MFINVVHMFIPQRCARSNSKDMSHITTKLIHAGEKPDPQTGAVAPVLVRTKTYAWTSFESDPTYKYSRGKNPTRSVLEEKISGLENVGPGEVAATVFSSGVAAETMLFLTLNPGDHIIFCHEVYGGTYRLIEQLFSKFGITADYVDFNDDKAVQRAIRSSTRYFFVETPTNPSLHIIDLERVGKLSKKTGIPFIVDATFSPPVTTDSFTYGAETVIYSLSKYHAGHNDVIGGAVVTRNKQLDEKLRFLQGTVGAVLSPDECYRVIQGLKTLDLRFKRASENAHTVAKFLESQEVIEKVYYPSLVSHPSYKLARKQMSGGCGAVLSFTLILTKDKKKNHTRVKNFVNSCIASELIVYGESLASPETILAYPPIMSHKSLPKDVRQGLGITDGFFRLSLGFEDPEEIIEVLKKALTSDRVGVEVENESKNKQKKRTHKGLVVGVRRRRSIPKRHGNAS